MYAVDMTFSQTCPGGWWRRRGSVPCMQWGTFSETCLQGGGEEDLSHVRSRGRLSETCRQWEDLSHVRSGGCSVRHVPSGGWERIRGAKPCTQRGTFSQTCPSGKWGRRGESVICTQWGMLSDTCPHWGIGEERRISAMYSGVQIARLCRATTGPPAA